MTNLSPLVPRPVVIHFACGHAVTLGIPPEADPPPGFVLHCYTCDQDVAVVSVASQADLAAQTPILYGGDTP